jgi:hypothetical protein
MDSRAKTANYLYGAAAILGATAGVTALFTDWHGYRSSMQVRPAHKGATVAIAVSF